MKKVIGVGVLMLMLSGVVACGNSAVKATQTSVRPKKIPKNPNKIIEGVDGHKFVIYQSLVRLFGNKMTANIKNGTREQNGVGHFGDYTDKALQELKKLGITHMWYTGVIEHAIMEDLTAYGIALDDADVVKGRAGSPYAIKDYYDVDPVLAENIKNRMSEFQSLVDRTHRNGLKVILDFVPNHVARRYVSDAKPAGVKDFGENDDTNKAFDSNNNFYYLPGKSFVPPKFDELGKKETFVNEDGKFDENPAKVTGNDQFTATPSVGTWYETVKLNYGVDIQKGRKKHFDPVPNTWKKMVGILKYWTAKGVDGFRCDMAEMVPVEFWGWAIPQVKKVNPNVIFIAEIYNPNAYKDYLHKGHFDYLYDKIGLYDAIRPLMSGSHGASAKNVYYAWRKVRDYAPHMLTFLENHDEQRIASKGFAKHPKAAYAGMTLAATIYAGPTMIYFGQEVGEPAAGAEGFGGKDGRTTIFDYWGVPEFQKWMDGGRFDGGRLSADQKKLRAYYSRLLNLVKTEPALSGQFFDLYYANRKGQSTGFDDVKTYAFLRYTDKEQILVVVYFNKKTGTNSVVKIPAEAWIAMDLDPTAHYELKELLFDSPSLSFNAKDVQDRLNPNAGVSMKLKPMSAVVYRIVPKK